MKINYLEAIQAFAEQFAADHLDEYIIKLKSPLRPRKRKEINDPIWGTISLSPIEVAIVDSPLLQRLREIKQLGVVHWVYPGATHTRFEHTLGVLFQVQNLVFAINRISDTQAKRPPIDDSYEKLLRIAALMHDTGHAAFSHVTEFALNEVPEIIAARGEFERLVARENKQLSEIIAYYIVKSPAFRRLIDVLFDQHDGFVRLSEIHETNVQLLIDKIADSIIGKKISEEIPILHEIISGPFDADKLDYFTRDSRYCGTPSVVDISRLIQKMAVRNFPAEQLPEAIAREAPAAIREFTLFGIKWSGIPVLDELHLARVLLFSKVYKHGKVTALEQMLSIVVRNLVRVVGVDATILLLYWFGDSSILELRVETICAILAVNADELTQENAALLSRVEEILKDLKYRRPHMKAFQALRNYPSEEVELMESQSLKMIDFCEDLASPTLRPELVAAISQQLREVNLAIIGRSEEEDIISTRFSVAVAGHIPGGTQVGRAFLIPDTGSPIQFSQYRVNRGGWADAYLSDQPMAHVFSEESVADSLFVAIEKVVRLNYELVLPESAVPASKRNADQVRAIKEKLAQGKFYQGVPHDIRPMPRRLQRADISTKVTALEKKFAAYDVPDVDNIGAGKKVDRARIISWLRQFEQDHRIECAIRCLEAVKIIRRADTVSALKGFIDKNPEFHGSPVIGFGDAKDSGVIQAYLAGDALESHISRIATLSQESLRRTPPTHILFVDDFIGSGGQSKDVLAAGLGIQQMRQDLSEQRELFSDKENELLRSAKCGFVFSAGWKEGAENLRSAAEEMGINAHVHLGLSDPQLPCIALKPDQFLSQEQIDEFRVFCEETGRQLILSSSEETDPTKLQLKADQRWLGYGNKGLLVASSVNTPTQTWTMLWSGGKAHDLDWMPLLPRRKKK